MPRKRSQSKLTLETEFTIGTEGKKGVRVSYLTKDIETLAQNYLTLLNAEGDWVLRVELRRKHGSAPKEIKKP